MDAGPHVKASDTECFGIIKNSAFTRWEIRNGDVCMVSFHHSSYINPLYVFWWIVCSFVIINNLLLCFQCFDANVIDKTGRATGLVSHRINSTVYPKKYAHGFCFAVLCCGYTLTDFPISIRLTSLALWQSNDCPSASKATLMNMDKYFMWIHYERLHNHNKAKHNKTVCIFLGIYCT